jgi:hypothetical protein
MLYLLLLTSSTSWHLYLTVAYAEIASEIINALVATKKHEILSLSRKVCDLTEPRHGEASVTHPRLGTCCDRECLRRYLGEDGLQ